MLAFLIPITGYCLVLSFSSIISRASRKNRYPANTRFAVIIPAHNEEVIIGRTLDNLRGIEYPQQLVSFIVVADNCDDRTAEIAREKKVVVYERFDRNKMGKGYALDWVFTKLLRCKENYDAFVVLDADSILSPNYLTAMNDMLFEGHSVIQGYYTVLNVTENWRTSLMFASFALVCYLRPQGKDALGLSAGLMGNGMCFSRKVLENVKWDCYSVVEDTEYSIKLRMNGIRVKFAPEAVVYAVMPVSFRQARSQRIRWEGGGLEVIKRFFPSLLYHSIQKKRISAVLEAFEMLNPPYTVAFGTSLIFLLISILGNYLWDFPHSRFYLIAWTLVITAQATYLFSGLILAGAPLKVYFSLLCIPVYMVWKIWIYFLIITGVNRGEWTRTSRKGV